MKILYIKNNSERAKEFQLRTVIYEDNGQKYVKKEALCKEAVPHLKRMKESYKTLTESIVNPKIKLAKIIAEDEQSLTFEYIDGVSLEKKLLSASERGEDRVQEVITAYVSLVKTAFKTIQFESQSMVTQEHKRLFGDLDFSKIDGELCFEKVTNLDLIFSNIIYTADDIYLIDYEWTYDISLPLSYVIHRTMMSEDAIPQTIKDEYATEGLLYLKMERHLINENIMKNGFYFYRKNYIKVNYSVLHHLQEKDNYINRLSQRINTLDNQIQSVGDDLHYARSIVEQRDAQLQNRVNTNHSENIFKKIIKKVLSVTLRQDKKPQKEKIENDDSTIIDSTGTVYAYQEPVLTQIIKDELKNFRQKPLISIVMPVYNIDRQWLNLAIKSIEMQWYENWELCIADDKSTKEETIAYLKQIKHPNIKVTFLKENLNISAASNAAISMATGEYIALMDNDDEITPDALYEMVKIINDTGADFIYSDEDFVSTEGEFSNPHFKPDFSPDLLLSHNYITHFSCFKKELLDKVGGFNSEFDGSQDYDLFLRLTEQTSKIQHIPKVLYHWRMLETSTSINPNVKPEAANRGKLVLEETMKRRGIKALVENANIPHYFKVKYEILDSPLVSIIIPFKDKPELLAVCIESILKKSTYQKFEIIGISNNSEEPEIFQLMAELEQKDPRISFYEYNVDFNYADINNHAVKTYAKGEHILLLNNDIEVISPDWIEAMLGQSQRDEVGCVGAKLYYPNDTVQHAGIIMGLGGYAGHSHKMYSRFNSGYYNRLNIVQNLSAVTAACLMVKKSIYDEVNGMDEIRFKVAYNDVDFCLRVREKGYLNIFTPYAEMYHHESVSRGYETTPEKIARFQTEKDALFERHKEILVNGDPYYSPNLSHDTEDFSIKDISDKR